MKLTYLGEAFLQPRRLGNLWLLFIKIALSCFRNSLPSLLTRIWLPLHAYPVLSIQSRYDYTLLCYFLSPSLCNSRPASPPSQGGSVPCAHVYFSFHTTYHLSYVSDSLRHHFPLEEMMHLEHTINGRVPWVFFSCLSPNLSCDYGDPPFPGDP
jgi:hypothetical protein